MQELKDKYKSWHGETDEEWKVACIALMIKEPGAYVDVHQDIDWLYDDAIDFLFTHSTRRIKNVAKKLGHEEPPCLHCRNIIKHYKDNVDFMWSPDYEHLFKK